MPTRTPIPVSATLPPRTAMPPPPSATVAGTDTATPTVATTPAPSGEAGFIEGTVQAGPTCPVERIDSPCPDRPIEADVTILDGAGAVVARARSDAHGHFTVEVPPGSYTVRGEPPATGPFPRPAQPVEVTVVAGATAAVTLTYDTGIR